MDHLGVLAQGVLYTGTLPLCAGEPNRQVMIEITFSPAYT